MIGSVVFGINAGAHRASTHDAVRNRRWLQWIHKKGGANCIDAARILHRYLDRSLADTRVNGLVRHLRWAIIWETNRRTREMRSPSAPRNRKTVSRDASMK